MVLCPPEECQVARGPTTPQEGAITNSPAASPSFGVRLDGEPARCSSLALQVMAEAGCGSRSAVEDFVLNILLPQLNIISPSVNAAMAALGAVYSSVYLHKERNSGSSLALHMSRRAIAALQADIPAQPHGPVPLFLASILLAAAEVMQRHHTNALMHLDGAICVLRTYIYTPKSSVKHSLEAGEFPSGIGHSEDSLGFCLHSIAQALDLQVSSFVMNRPPRLPSATGSSILEGIPTTLDSADVHSTLLTLLNSRYYFISQNSAYSRRSPAEVPAELHLEQNRHLAALSHWLITFNSDLHSTNPKIDHAANQHRELRNLLLTFHTQCLTAYIYISTLLNPYETAYDALAHSFQQILTCAASLLTHRQTPRFPFHHFSFLPGLAPALFVTAMKYRHPLHRRRAIELLDLADVEGPWDPKTLVTVAKRAVQIEEAYLDLSFIDIEQFSPGTINEAHRLHGFGMASATGHQAQRGPEEVLLTRRGCAERVMVTEYRYEAGNHWALWVDLCEI